MKSEFTIGQKRDFARDMREQPTAAEHALWKLLRRGQLGPRFQRQILLQGYIVDFYCATKYLAIEVDGSIHDREDVAGNDAEKDARLDAAGIAVLRFTNDDVLNFPTVVLTRIRAKLGLKGSTSDLKSGRERIESSSSRGTAKVDDTVNRNHRHDLNEQPETGKLSEIPITPEEIAELNSRFRRLVGQSKRQASAFEYDNRLAREKALNQKVQFANWLKTPEGAPIREHIEKLAARKALEDAGQLYLDMPSSEKKGQETEIAAVVVRKGLAL